MGILDSKERILDIIITKEGRRQLAAGESFNPTYVSFSDRHAFYKYEDIKGIAGDATSRIYFESVSMPEDSIIFEVDDSGNTVGFEPTMTAVVGQNGGILLLSQSQNNEPIYTLVTGSDFASLAGGIATGSIDNLKSQRLIGSVNNRSKFGKKYSFDLSDNTVSFNITNHKPFNTRPRNAKANVNSLKPLFYDERLAHLPNFQFLPPVTKEGNNYGEYNDLSGGSLGTFQNLIDKIGSLPIDIKQKDDYDFYTQNITGKSLSDAIKSVTGISENSQNDGLYERFSINFQNTNFSNNVFAQIFEIPNSDEGLDASYEKKMTKLDLIDFGEFIDPDDDQRKRKHVYFAGKIFVDDSSLPCFVNLFTLVFD